jgi:hypothetical protein
MRSNTHTQNPLPNKNSVHILPKYSWDIFQDRPHNRAQIKSQYIENESCLVSSDHNRGNLEINGRCKFVEIKLLYNQWMKDEIMR